jgi:hypothetical protein
MGLEWNTIEDIVMRWLEVFKTYNPTFDNI